MERPIPVNVNRIEIMVVVKRSGPMVIARD